MTPTTVTNSKLLSSQSRQALKVVLVELAFVVVFPAER
jgi:hypothetical protein